MSNERLAAGEPKLAFVFQIIALTQTRPNGTKISKPLGAVFEETQTHAATAPSPPAAVDLPHLDSTTS